MLAVDDGQPVVVIHQLVRGVGHACGAGHGWALFLLSPGDHASFRAQGASSIQASETTIREVVADVDGAVAQLNQRTAELRERGESVRLQVQQLMQAMDKRSHTQLRLQQTVEGLSVAAISYYLVGLYKYLAESAKSLGLLADSQLATGLAVPLCIGLVWFSLRRLKRRLKLGEG